MNSIVNKLSEIEATAKAIVAHAEEQKPVIEREIQDKRDAFDLQLEQETRAKVQAIRDELQHNMDGILEEQRKKNSAVIESLIQDFETNHTAYADQILKKMIEV